jgi:hypothetical protein
MASASCTQCQFYRGHSADVNPPTSYLFHSPSNPPFDTPELATRRLTPPRRPRRASSVASMSIEVDDPVETRGVERL